MRKSAAVIGDCRVALAVIAAVAIGGLPLIAMPIDMSGRQPRSHAEAMPDSLTPISARLYIVPLKSGITPERLCHGGTGPIDTVDPITKMNAILVRCNQGQAWGKHGYVSPNYGHSLAMVAGSWEYLTAVIGSLVATLVYFLYWQFRYFLARPKKVKPKERVFITFKTKQDALALAYATGEITEAEWQAKMDEIYEQEVAMERMAEE